MHVLVWENSLSYTFKYAYYRAIKSKNKDRNKTKFQESACWCFFLRWASFIIVKINIKFAILTILKCTTQWHEAHPQCWATITAIRRHHHSSPKQELCALEKQTPHAPHHSEHSGLSCTFRKMHNSCTSPPDNPYFTFSVSLPIPGTSYKWNQTVSVFCEWHIPHFVYPFTCWWTCRCFCLWTMFVYNSVPVGVE